jgi:hypothetical protein
MGELGVNGRDWLRGVGVTVPVTGGGGNNQAISRVERMGGGEDGRSLDQGQDDVLVAASFNRTVVNS